MTTPKRARGTVSPSRGRGRPQVLPDPREFIPRLRAAGVPDAVIASAMGVSRQAIHARYGPRPDVPLLQVPPDPQPPRQSQQDGMQPPKTRAGILLTWRKRRGLTQAAAADALGVYTSTWARWESGRQGSRVPQIVIAYLKLTDKES